MEIPKDFEGYKDFSARMETEIDIGFKKYLDESGLHQLKQLAESKSILKVLRDTYKHGYINGMEIVGSDIYRRLRDKKERLDNNEV